MSHNNVTYVRFTCVPRARAHTRTSLQTISKPAINPHILFPSLSLSFPISIAISRLWPRTPWKNQRNRRWKWNLARFSGVRARDQRHVKRVSTLEYSQNLAVLNYNHWILCQRQKKKLEWQPVKQLLSIKIRIQLLILVEYESAKKKEPTKAGHIWRDLDHFLRINFSVFG